MKGTKGKSKDSESEPVNFEILSYIFKRKI